jgi:hypothetical protein
MSNSLQEKQKVLEEELNEQLSEAKDKAVEVGKQALVIAGGVFVAYQLVKLLTSSKKKKKVNSNQKVYQQIGVDENNLSGAQKIVIERTPARNKSLFLDELKAEFGSMLMGLVKAKIYEALEQLNNKMQKGNDETENS